MSRTDVLEIHLEVLGQHSWVKAAFNTLAGSHGSALFRFVARFPGDDEGGRADRVVGATFPMMRWQDLNDLTEPNGWLEVAWERLQELDQQLVADGWERLPGTGDHWWSLYYARPAAGTAPALTAEPTWEPEPSSPEPALR